MLHNRDKYSLKTILSRGIISAVLLVYSLVVLFPMLWTLMTSFKTNKEFYRSVWKLPASFNFDNYVTAWESANIGNNIINSIVAVSVTVVLTMFLSSCSAYAIARYKFSGNKFFEKIYMMGLFVPLVLGTIPTFFVLNDLSLYDTRIGLILVYTAYSLPLSVFILVSVFKTIPTTFAEAAMIDGYGDIRIFWDIMLPLSKSGIVTINIFNFLWTWNDYIYAMTYVPSSSKRTLPVGLVTLTETAMYKTEWGALFAGLVIIMIPSILVYIVFQKQLTKGLTEGGIKG